MSGMTKLVSTGQRGWCSPLLPVVLLLAVITPAPALADTGPDSRGTEFVLGFMANSGGVGDANLVLFITSDTDTSGTVSVPGVGFLHPFTVTAGDITSVNVPNTAMVTGSDAVTTLGVHVVADDEVIVYGLNQIQFSTDAFLGLPVDILRTHYAVVTWNETISARGFSPGPSQLLVVGAQDSTTVTITPSVSTGARAAGVPYAIILNALETYQLQTDGALEDLSGTIIQSDKPVALLTGVETSDVPIGFCCSDHLVQQLPPTDTWGTSFLAVSLATRTGGDMFRIMARDDGTEVRINGALVATLAANTIHDADLPSGAVHEIETTRPALVMQMSKGSFVDGITSDPFMMMIVPTQQFLHSYTISTPASDPVAFNNFVNLVVRTDELADCTVNGGPFTAAFSPIGASGFSGAQQDIGIGAHNLECPSGFGVYVYGYADFDSYGYPGGMALAVIAPREVHVNLDVQPTSCPNPLNRRVGGVLPVAILGTAGFDVTEINPSSVQLEGLSALRWEVEDVAAPHLHGISDPPNRTDCTTAGPDGFTDLTLKFDTQSVIAALGLLSAGDVVVVSITGELWDGTPIVGRDVVWIR